MSRFNPVLLALAMVTAPAVALGPGAGRAYASLQLIGLSSMGPFAEAEALPAGGKVCPIKIVPGKSLGPVKLGATRDDLSALGLPINEETALKGKDIQFLDVGPFHVELLSGKVADIWLDDIRLAPDCLFLGEKKVDRAIGRQKLAAMLAGCGKEDPRRGGTLLRCTSGVALGWGMGTFLQLRISVDGQGVAETLYPFSE